MPSRFYAPAAEQPGETVDLPDEESEHLTRVLRMKTGDSIRIFNGRGAEFDAVVDLVTRSGARVRVCGRRESQPESGVALTLVQSVLKSDSMDDVVRAAVMIGVMAIHPVVSARTEIGLASLRRARRHERWRRIAVSSAKQCGRAFVPAVFEPRDFSEWSSALAKSAPTLMFVEPSVSGAGASLRTLALQPPDAATIVIGPEGGWDPDEIGQGARMGQLVTLMSPTVRADAMALVAATALLAHWRQL